MTARSSVSSLAKGARRATPQLHLLRTARPGQGEQTGLAVPLPMEQATAVIGGMSARDDLVSIQLYGHPWVMGEYWPMITPCFEVRAIDDARAAHDGIPGSWHGSPSLPDNAAARVTPESQRRRRDDAALKPWPAPSARSTAPDP